MLIIIFFIILIILRSSLTELNVCNRIIMKQNMIVFIQFELLIFLVRSHEQLATALFSRFWVLIPKHYFRSWNKGDYHEQHSWPGVWYILIDFTVCLIIMQVIGLCCYYNLLSIIFYWLSKNWNHKLFFYPNLSE